MTCSDSPKKKTRAGFGTGVNRAIAPNTPPTDPPFALSIDHGARKKKGEANTLQ